MIRNIVVPRKHHISIDIPASFVGQRVEVIAYPLDEAKDSDACQTHLASEFVLAKDWLTPEEDKAWQDL